MWPYLITAKLPYLIMATLVQPTLIEWTGYTTDILESRVRWHTLIAGASNMIPQQPMAGGYGVKSDDDDDEVD